MYQSQLFLNIFFSFLHFCFKKKGKENSFFLFALPITELFSSSDDRKDGQPSKSKQTVNISHSPIPFFTNEGRREYTENPDPVFIFLIISFGFRFDLIHFRVELKRRRKNEKRQSRARSCFFWPKIYRETLKTPQQKTVLTFQSVWVKFQRLDSWLDSKHGRVALTLLGIVFRQRWPGPALLFLYLFLARGLFQTHRLFEAKEPERDLCARLIREEGERLSRQFTETDLALISSFSSAIGSSRDTTSSGTSIYVSAWLSKTKE